MIYDIDHISLAVADIVQSMAFYRDVLGFRAVDSREAATTDFYWLAFAPNKSINLAKLPLQTPKALGCAFEYGNLPHIAFSSSAIGLEAYRKRLTEAAIAYHDAGSSLYFSDPDGNGIEITYWRENALYQAGKRHW